ncbi:MAG: hypothetical protein ACFFD2_12175 [Promethearchaeota archaeon]
MKIDYCVFFTGLIIFLSYIIITAIIYGLRSSISALVKDYQKDGLKIIPHLFIILGVCFPFDYLAGTWAMVIGSSLLYGIGNITGYNPKMKPYKLQSNIHVILTLTAIIFYLFAIITLSSARINETQNLKISPLYCLLASIWLISTFVLWVKKVPKHTTWIEITGILMGYLCLYIENFMI